MPQGKQARVLIVDDEPLVRELLVDAMDGMDLRISTASSGEEAIGIAIDDPPDIVVTDVRLGDCTGMEMLDQLESTIGNVPAVVISGYADAGMFSEASRRRPIELLTKPLDIDRLRRAINDELDRQADHDRTYQRTRRLRHLARRTNIARKSIHRRLETTCADLTHAYRDLSKQLSVHQLVMSYQHELLAAKNDDDVFRSLFRLLVSRTGPLHGIAMVCDADAQLHVVGRFGVPKPDGGRFCELLSEPVVDAILKEPGCLVIDAGQEAELFDESIRRYLIGLTILAVPLIPAPGELIGIVLLYRKGEQPFVDDDILAVELTAPPTATAVRRND